MPIVHLGNSAAKDHVRDPDPDGDGGTVPIPIEGNQITTVRIPESYTRKEAIRTVWHDDGAWSRHSFASSPDWVESDDSGLAAALAAVFGCPIGRPDDWEIQA